MSKILVVEDDRAVRDVVEQSLCKEGLQTVGVADGEEALRYLRESNPIDVVILDLMLPGEIDGYSVCREIRAGQAGEENKDLPVVMLTARDDETSVVVGLEVGADDYVTKPFRIRELVSRVRARLRRQRLSDRAEQQRLEFPGLQLDLLKRLVFSGGESVELMAMEFDMLALIASHPGRVYERQQIMRCLSCAASTKEASTGRGAPPMYTSSTCAKDRARSEESPLHPNRARGGLQVRRSLKAG